MNKLKLISQYRSQLMGIATIWVMLYHTRADFGVQTINRLASIGYGGVDIFLFLSGFGLYYASRKRQSVAQFYRKRFIRLIPAYLVIMLLIELITPNPSLSSFLVKATTIGYWLPFTNLAFFTWYVPAILLLYLIFPFYIKWFDRSPHTAMITAIAIGFILSFIYSYVFTVHYPMETNMLLFFTARIPIFVIGIYFGMLSLQQSFSRTKMFFCTFAVAVGMGLLFYFVSHYDLWALRNKGLYFYPFIFITPGLCLLLCYLFSWLPKLMNRCLIIIGGTSLEIYLIHEKLFTYNHLITKFFQCSTLVGFFILMIISIGIAQLISVMIKQGLSSIKRVVAHYSENEQTF